MINKKYIAVICALTAVIVFSSFTLYYSGAYAVFFVERYKKLPIYSVETDEKKLAISFDCAWGVDYTDKLLETMQFYNVRSTFFMVQFWAEKYPEYVKKIDAAGHEIGTHSATHSHMSKMTESEIQTELESSSSAIEKITAKKVTLFRCPFGEYDDKVIETAERLNLKVIQWNIDSLDWKDLSAEQIALRIVSKAENGAIILCHNNGLHTAESLPLVFSDLTNKGYEFVTISELVIKDNYSIDINGRQRASV